MEAIVRGINNGAALIATLALPISIDLTVYIGRYVKIRGDQDFLFVFRPDATATMDTTVTLPVNSLNVPDAGGGGTAGVHRLVTGVAPFLVLRGLSANSNITIKPTSEKVSV